MCSTSPRLLLLLQLFAINVALWSSASGQNLPPNACSQYFEYQQYGGTYIGKVTLPNLGMGSNVVDVALSQRVPVHSNYYGSLSLFYDQDTTIRNLQRGAPISYRIDFPFPNVVPKLTQISVNNQVICETNAYPPPSTRLSLQHTLQTTAQPFVPVYRPSLPDEPVYQTFPVAPQLGNPFLGNPMRNRGPIRPNQLPQATTQAPAVDNRRDQSFTNVQCGREGGSNTRPLVFGGTELQRGQFPWLAVINLKEAGRVEFKCGGSLIARRTVITAAHCFKLTNLRAEQILVYLGRHDLNNYRESFESHDVANLIMHESYNPLAIPDADVAILQLQDAASYSQYIQPICLWTESDNADLIVGQTGVVAGWGADEGGRVISPRPKMVDTNIVSRLTCLESLEAWRNLTSENTICAGNRDGTGPCTGDSGSGLMLRRNGIWTLRGVVSVGQTVERRCNLREYVVYCDIAKRISWVRRNMLE